MYGFDIERFKAYIEEDGILQTNKFDVTIFLQGPLANYRINDQAGNSDSNRQTSRDLTYRCIAASLPGMVIRTSDVNRYGLGIFEKMPFSANYTDIDLTFICDRYGLAYSFWYTWFNYIFGMNGATSQSNIFGQTNNDSISKLRGSYYTAEYKDNYAATVNITVYDTEGLEGIRTTLLKAYPISINDIPLSWGDNNNLVKLSVKMTFTEWVLGDPQTQTTLGGGVRTNTAPQQ
jgi:hypothetical protein